MLGFYSDSVSISGTRAKQQTHGCKPHEEYRVAPRTPSSRFPSMRLLAKPCYELQELVNHEVPSWNQVREWLLELEELRMGCRQGRDGRLG